MKRLLLILFLFATGCATVFPATKDKPLLPKEESSVLINVDSHIRRDRLINQLQKEFRPNGENLRIGLSGFSSDEKKNQRMPFYVWGTVDLVETISRRAIEISGEKGYKIVVYPANIYELRLPDVLLSDPDTGWSKSLSFTMAAEKVLHYLAGNRLINYRCSGQPTSIHREEEREFVFKDESVCQRAYKVTAPLVDKYSGFVAQQGQLLYCAGKKQFVESVTETVGKIGVKCKSRRYAFASLRLYRLYDKLPLEAQELCKYIFCRSVEELSSTIEYASCCGPPFPGISNSSQIDSFIISLARYAVATETIEHWKAIKESIRLEEFIVPAVGVMYAVRTLVVAKDKASIPLLFSKAMVGSAACVDYGTEYVEGIAGILGEDAVWHLVAIAESPTASFETRREAMAYLEKIDTPVAKSAVRQLKCIPLPEEDDLEDDDDTDDE